jgi:hypothetical protein
VTEVLKVLVTLTGMIVPNAVIMRAMGWHSVAHIALLAGWAVISAALIIMSPQRHRRPEWRKYPVVLTLVVWTFLGALILGTSWNVRAVLAVLLLLPGVNYLLLEAIGLTPRPTASGPPLL